MKNSPTPSTLHSLLILAIPTFGQLIAEPTFVLIDTAIVGHVSDSALAGLSLGSMIILTAVGLCVFLAYSTTSQVARLLGAGNRRQGMQAGIHGLWLAGAIGILLAVALYTCAAPLASALGGTGETLQQASIYTQLVALGVPGMLLVYAANGIFRGLQKVNITLVAAVSGAVLNTVLDVVFVIVMGLGIAGSGIATCIAQWFMGIMLVIPALLWARREGARLTPSLSGILAAGGDGFVLFIRTVALRAGLVATVMAAAAMGTEVLAGYQIVNATWSFALNALDAVAIAGQTLVGSEIGGKAYSQARALTNYTARIGLITGCVIALIFIGLGFVAGPLFSPNSDIQTLSCVGVIAVGIGLPLQGWMWALDGILIGAGDFRYLALTCLASSGSYLVVLGCVVGLIAPLMPNDLVRTALMWLTFDIVLMGGRALANGLRAKGDVWMHRQDSL